MKRLCIIVRKDKKSQANDALVSDNLPEINKLVDKAALGDFEAFGQLYTIFLDRIYRYAFYQVRDKMTAEDITEEVFVKAWKAIKSCKGKGHTFSAWIYRIAHNHIINTFRRVHRYIPVDIEKMTGLHDQNPDAQMTLEQQELLDTISELPPSQAQVITLKFIEGLDNREIAQIMGKSEGSVRVMQLRGLTALRKKIGGGKHGARC